MDDYLHKNWTSMSLVEVGPNNEKIDVSNLRRISNRRMIDRRLSARAYDENMLAFKSAKKRNISNVGPSRE